MESPGTTQKTPEDSMLKRYKNSSNRGSSPRRFTPLSLTCLIPRLRGHFSNISQHSYRSFSTLLRAFLLLQREDYRHSLGILLRRYPRLTKDSQES